MGNAWTQTIDAAVALRRALHRSPELTWAEVETARKIRRELDRLDIPWRACAETGTIGQIASDAPGCHIALRADIDALPILEATGVDYASEVVGRMHACGHDGHTATLWAAAQWLKQHESQLPGPVSFFFQPAEEGGHGARRMIEEGALEGIDTIFGWHNWPAIPFGKAVCPDGAVMAANGTFSIAVHGEGGHASQPELCRDPVLAASAITLALQQVVSRRIAPQQAAVVSVTSIDAPSFDTAIPGEVRMGGSIRIADSALRGPLTGLMRQCVEDTARAYGVYAELEMQPRYEATVNHAGPAALYREAIQSVLGPDWRDTSCLVPVMASEDFSYYVREIPGAFALVGAGGSAAHSHPCHSPYYDFNDDLIPVVAGIYLRLAGLAGSVGRS